MSDELGFAFHDLPEDHFPFLVLFTREDTDEVVHWVAITEPGGVLIPGFGDEEFTVSVQMYFPGGNAMEVSSDGQKRALAADPERAAVLKQITDGVINGQIENGAPLP